MEEDNRCVRHDTTWPYDIVFVPLIVSNRKGKESLRCGAVFRHLRTILGCFRKMLKVRKEGENEGLESGCETSLCQARHDSMCRMNQLFREVHQLQLGKEMTIIVL